MADVRINEIDSQVTITDADSLLTPEIMNRLVTAVSQRLEEKERMSKIADDDRRLVEGASR